VRVRIVGPGRAGLSFSKAFTRIGWQVLEHLGRNDDLTNAAEGVDLVLLSVPDKQISNVAQKITVSNSNSAAIVHISGSLTLDPLSHHERIASCHPLLSLPDSSLGEKRLLDKAWFAVAGDPISIEIVRAFDGKYFHVPDEKRALYHAGACIAANHLVVLLSQVERICEIVDIPFEAYANLIQGTLDSVTTIGSKKSLTGPAVRGDLSTIQSHLDALPQTEKFLYSCLSEAAQEFATKETKSQNMKT
jgi:predicted short-subunit dehydrogenase-like oxidoreductase (DUF2520 family)|tara:strand:- start:422 stop:1162 length:741 start_codon:yes stop_codon:yes gene_type:complete